MCIPLLMSSPLFSQVYSGLNAHLEFNNPLLNIATYERGAVDPAYGRGIIGSYINPASLPIHRGNSEIYFAYSLSKRYESRSSILLVDADSIDILSKDLILDSDLKVTDPGGLDFIGFTTRVKGFDIGTGVFSRFTSSIDVNGVAGIEAGLTFDSIPSVLQLGDTALLLLWKVTGWGQMESVGNGRMDVSKQPIFFRIAKKFGIISIGAGYDIELINGSSAIELSAQGGLDSIYAVADSAVNLITGYPVTVMARADFLMEDTLFNMLIHGKTHGIRHGLGAGLRVDLKLIKLGLVGKVWFPFKLHGQDLNGRIIFAYGIPDSVIYPPEPDFRNDTLFINAGTVEFRDLLKDTVNMFERGMTIEMPTTYSVAVGIAIGIFHISGLLNWTMLSGISYGGWVLSGGVHLPLPGGKIGLTLSQATDFINDGAGRYIPVHAPGYLGLGGTVSMGSWELGLGLKFNLMSLGIQTIGNQLTEFRRPDFFKSVSISFGISKTIGG